MVQVSYTSILIQWDRFFSQTHAPVGVKSTAQETITVVKMGRISAFVSKGKTPYLQEWQPQFTASVDDL